MSIVEIYQTAQIRAMESYAKERFGISGDVMMQRAGKAAWQFFLKRWPLAKQVIVVCGQGNNGGDGYVFAQKAHEQGLKVIVLHVGDVEKLKDEASRAFLACQTSGVTIRPYQREEELQQCDVIVDALFGIGLQSELRKDSRLVIEAINHAHRPVFAIDVPSGVNANSGSVMGAAVQAEATITFIGIKVGLMTGAGVACRGDLFCDDLQLPAELFEMVRSHIDVMDRMKFLAYLRPRSRDFHKGKAGHVVVIGGDEGYSGAPCMAALGALRVGAGLVTVATHPKHAAYLNIGHPEVMCVGVRTPLALKKLLQKATVLVVGPGLGQSLWAKMLWSTILKSELPMVVDADGLNLLAQHPIKHSNWILTPHPGEAARLLHQSTAEVQQDRLKAVSAIQENFGGFAVLKGVGTLVAATDKTVSICDAGNPGMSTAGTGDILSGVIGGLLAQGIPLACSAKLGALIHAKAGDMAAQEGGERGLMATDLLPFLRKLMNP